MIVKTKDDINISELRYIYYINIKNFELITIDLYKEKIKSRNY